MEAIKKIEINKIAKIILGHMNKSKKLAGKKCIITAGPTTTFNLKKSNYIIKKDLKVFTESFL